MTSVRHVAVPFLLAVSAFAAPGTAEPHDPPAVRYGHVAVDGVRVFYREAGDPSATKIVLLHGFPTSSHMFRNLIPRLARRFHVLAPDYPGFGLSDAPPRADFAYTFDNLARVVQGVLRERGFDRYALYLMDYGAPVGFRIATAAPERVTALIVQNGNAYEQGLREFWDPIKAYWRSGAAADREALRRLLTLEATRWQYRHGTRRPDSISPDSWLVDQPLLDRSGNAEIQLDLFYDYRNNLPLYPQWQSWLREQRPPTLIVWGKNDQIFPADGAYPYLQDLPEAELHLLDTGHFALEEDGDRIAAMIRSFLVARVLPEPAAK